MLIYFMTNQIRVPMSPVALKTFGLRFVIGTLMCYKKTALVQKFTVDT